MSEFWAVGDGVVVTSTFASAEPRTFSVSGELIPIPTGSPGAPNDNGKPVVVPEESMSSIAAKGSTTSAADTGPVGGDASFVVAAATETEATIRTIDRLERLVVAFSQGSEFSREHHNPEFPSVALVLVRENGRDCTATHAFEKDAISKQAFKSK